ncbi:hypothetical protein DW757_07220 [Clostridium sp. AM29-11AC]|nr:hypothetical protein DW757_07220 [Clostridium sp. AM29-11AC]
MCRLRFTEAFCRAEKNAAPDPFDIRAHRRKEKKNQEAGTETAGKAECTDIQKNREKNRRKSTISCFY